MAFALVAAKLALVWNRPLFGRGLPHDDLLFLRLAESISRGDWLGGYDQLTLAKGPFLSIFVAATAPLGVPFLLTQELLYQLSAAIVILAVAPVLRSRVLRLLVFALLLFNPATLSSDSTLVGVSTAVLTREPIYTSLSLLVIAGLIGLWTYRERHLLVRIAWSLCLGCSLGPFWLTREEGVWIVPSLVLGLTATAWHAWRSECQAPRWRTLMPLAPPFVLWAAAVGVVDGLNWKYYGVFTSTELHSPSFTAAYGALTRVKHPHWVPNLPVPSDVRAQLYQVSPAARELQRWLEDRGSGWFAYGCPFYPHTCGDLTGGWFIWALRDAVTAAGYHHTGAAAAAFYFRLAQEINDACDRGELDCDPRRDSLLDPIRRYHIEVLPGTVGHAVERTIGFSDILITNESWGAMGGPLVDVYARMTHHAIDGRLQPPAEWQVEISNRILALYQSLAPPLTTVAFVYLLGALVALLWRREAPLVLPSGLILLALAVRFVGLAVAAVVSSTPYAPRYYQPQFALILLFTGLSCCGLLQLVAQAGAAFWHRRGPARSRTMADEPTPAPTSRHNALARRKIR